MSYRVHEIHPSVVHAPLVLLPTAALVDLAAVRSRRSGTAAVGRALWIAAAASAATAGVSGFASASEVKIDEPHAEDMLFLHGATNVCVLLGTVALTAARLVRRRPSALLATLGLLGSAVAVYTAYLGGEMVYGHGVGVSSMPTYMPQGVKGSPEVFSREAPATFVRDIGKGISWIVGRGRQALAGRRAVDSSALAG